MERAMYTPPTTNCLQYDLTIALKNPALNISVSIRMMPMPSMLKSTETNPMLMKMEMLMILMAKRLNILHGRCQNSIFASYVCDERRVCEQIHRTKTGHGPQRRTHVPGRLHQREKRLLTATSLFPTNFSHLEHPVTCHRPRSLLVSKLFAVRCHDCMCVHGNG